MATLTTRDGTELTDELTEALADEAERGYDLRRAERELVGRPSLGGSGPSPRVQVRVEPELVGALRACARREKRSVSAVARTALHEYLERSR